MKQKDFLHQPLILPLMRTSPCSYLLHLASHFQGTSSLKIVIRMVLLTRAPIQWITLVTGLLSGTTRPGIFMELTWVLNGTAFSFPHFSRAWANRIGFPVPKPVFSGDSITGLIINYQGGI